MYGNYRYLPLLKYKYGFQNITSDISWLIMCFVHTDFGKYEYWIDWALAVR